jgi:glycosyltransferase involved in cell wall biosynthesis
MGNSRLNTDVSLIVTTYNWPRALDLTLASVAHQSYMPAEVIIADDGSGPETAQVIENAAGRLDCDVHHVWQEDRGYRLARSRNRAIAAARSEYIVLVDGDMILHPRFVEDHMRCARPDCFIQGARPRLSQAITERLLHTGGPRPSVFTSGIEHRAYALRNVLLSRWASRARDTLSGIQGCNQSFWRKHVVGVNGYDERFTAWGPEDREFAARLLHTGLKRNYVRHRAIAFHLHHRSRAPQGYNPFDRLLSETLLTRAVWCKHGLDTHLHAMLPSRTHPAIERHPGQRV